MLLNIVIGLLYTPIMIRLLGQSEYGLYQTVTSTISMLSVLNLGFNAGYIRYYAGYKIKNDYENIYRLNGLFLLIFTVIGVVAFSCGIYLNFHIDMVFSDGLTEQEYSIVHILLFLLTINLSISFPMSVFQNIISANERFIVLKTVAMIRTVASPMITLPLLLMGYRSVAMVTITVLFSLITDVIYMYYVICIMKNRFIFHGFQKGIFKELFVYTVFIAINSIIDQINLNIDKVLLARFKGTTQVSIYAVGYAMYSYYQTLSTSVSGVFIPRIHHIVNVTKSNLEEQKQQLTELFTKVGRIQFIILALVLSGFALFGMPFIVDIWAGKGYESSYYVALLLMGPATIALTQNLGIEIQRAENRHQFRSIVYLIMAVVNLVLSIYLCQIYGAIGSAIGTAISFVLANGIVMNIFYHKKCNINVVYFWKNILGLLLVMTIPIVIGIVAVNMINLHKITNMFLGIVFYTVIYFSVVWKLGMNEYERGLVKGLLARLKKVVIRQGYN